MKFCGYRSVSFKTISSSFEETCWTGSQCNMNVHVSKQAFI